MYKIAICDCNLNDIKHLRDTINKTTLDQQKYTFTEYLSGYALTNNIHKRYDLIFLDIDLQNENGINLAKKIKKLHEDVIIVFYSFQSPTVEIFKAQPYRYIMKDSPEDKMIGELQDVINELVQRHQLLFYTATSKKLLVNIRIEDILYVSKKKVGSTFYVYNNQNRSKATEIPSQEKVDDIFNTLSRSHFEYAHSSYIVNLRNVIKLEKDAVFLKGDIILNISRNKSQNFYNSYNGFIKLNKRQ